MTLSLNVTDREKEDYIEKNSKTFSVNVINELTTITDSSFFQVKHFNSSSRRSTRGFCSLIGFGQRSLLPLLDNSYWSYYSRTVYIDAVKGENINITV